MTAPSYFSRLYVWNVLVWLTQGLNVLAWHGDPDESTSSRLGKMQRKYGKPIPWRYPLARIVSEGLDGIVPNHCRDSIEDDEG